MAARCFLEDKPVRHPARHPFVFVMLWTSLALAGSDAGDLRKPAPGEELQPFRERLMTLVRERYPQLLTAETQGTPVLRVLFNSDGTIARSDLEITSEHMEELTARRSQFARFHLEPGALKYLGAGHLPLPGRTALVIFGGLGSNELDRALIERYFPAVAKHALPVGEGVWILFDQEGRVLRTGTERIDPGTLRQTLEARYPGIRTSDMAVSPVARDRNLVKNSSEAETQLYSVWLAVRSPPPGP
jgi:hypothetical protein